MKCRVIVPATLHQHEEVSHSLWRNVRIHLERQFAQTRVQQDVPSQFVNGGVLKRLFFLCFYLDAYDPDRGHGQLVRINRDERNLVHYLNSFRHLSERREVSVELGLGRGAYEKLGASAVRAPCNHYGGHRAANMRRSTKLVRRLGQAAGTPALARCVRVFQERIAYLDYSPWHNSVKC